MAPTESKSESESMVVETSVEQILNGLQVGAGSPPTTCCWCGRDLHDGHCITVYAYRTAGHDNWNLPRISCRDCGSDEIETPTLGTTEIVATAFLGVLQVAAAQTTRHALTNVELVASSPPNEGTEP